MYVVSSSKFNRGPFKLYVALKPRFLTRLSLYSLVFYQREQWDQQPGAAGWKLQQPVRHGHPDWPAGPRLLWAPRLPSGLLRLLL